MLGAAGVRDGALVIATACLAGGLAPFAPLPVLVGAAAMLAILVRARVVGRAVALAAVAALAVGAARASAAVARFDEARERARDAIGPPSRCEAEATVIRSPVRVRGALRWDAELAGVVCEERPIAFPVRARLYGGPDALARGDRVFVVATLAPVQLFRELDLADPRPGAARSGAVASGGVVDARFVAPGGGVAAWIDRARSRVRARIDATFAPDAAGMGRALVLGESDLDPADDEAFRTSGLAHLLAVSGTHLVLVVAGAVGALEALLRRVAPLAARLDVGRVAAAAGAALAWAYADFAGGSGSARRAAAMASCLLVARALGRRGAGPRALALSLLGLAAADPLAAHDVSLLLSAAATAGLLAWAAPWRDALAARLPPVAARLAGPLATTAAASVPCAPLIAGMSPTVPVGGLVANLLAVPIGELASLPVCLAHALLAPAPAAERGAALVASGSLLAVRAVARSFAAARWLAPEVPPPTAWQWVALAAGATLAATARPGRRARAVLATFAGALLLELPAIRAGRPHGLLRVTVLDVGQGDAAIVDLPDGRAMLVDGGGLVGSPVDTGRSVILPVLRARRRSRVDVAVLSHPHPDHFLGLASALPSLDVGELWDTGQGEREGTAGAYAALLAGLRARGVPLRRPDALCGAPRSFGGAKVEVLAPCPGPEPGGSANDNSIVLRVSLGARAALLVGDAEHEAEARLLAAGPASLHADFLKVGHHGSRTSSTPRFLAATGATTAAISTGVRNRFGHPHAETLRSLAAAGVDVLRTDRAGAILWETDGASVRVRTAAGGR